MIFLLLIINQTPLYSAFMSENSELVDILMAQPNIDTKKTLIFHYFTYRVLYAFCNDISKIFIFIIFSNKFINSILY